MRKLKAKRIVVKIGTNTITDKRGKVDLKVIKNVSEQISNLKSNGKEVMIITSGAIGAGMQELNLAKKPGNVIMKQVCAGVGQNILMSNYYSFFSKLGIKISQILLTYEDFKNEKTFKNLKNSINKMLDMEIVPVINENDPISIDEIGPSFGDNDNLSALIASRLKADLMVILTNVDGLFNKDPSLGDAKLVMEVNKIDDKVESMAGKPSSLGIGGMRSKIQAAKIATDSGVNVVIANGKEKNILMKVLNNEEIGTVFYAK